MKLPNFRIMPEEDAIETIVDLKTSWPEVKIIAISGGGRWEEHSEFVRSERSLGMARRFEAERKLEKPVSIQHLLTLVDELLKQSR